MTVVASHHVSGISATHGHYGILIDFCLFLKRYPTCFLPAWFGPLKPCVLKAIPLAFDHDNPSMSLIHLDKVLRLYGGLGVMTTFSAINGICDWRFFMGIPNVACL